jgi:hypothetical protein
MRTMNSVRFSGRLSSLGRYQSHATQPRVVHNLPSFPTKNRVRKGRFKILPSREKRLLLCLLQLILLRHGTEEIRHSVVGNLENCSFEPRKWLHQGWASRTRIQQSECILVFTVSDYPGIPQCISLKQFCIRVAYFSVADQTIMEKHVLMCFSCHLGCLQSHYLCNQRADYYQI